MMGALTLLARWAVLSLHFYLEVITDVKYGKYR